MVNAHNDNTNFRVGEGIPENNISIKIQAVKITKIKDNVSNLNLSKDHEGCIKDTIRYNNIKNKVNTRLGCREINNGTNIINMNGFTIINYNF